MAIFARPTISNPPLPGLTRTTMRLTFTLAASTVSYERDGRYMALRGTCLLGEIVVMTPYRVAVIEPHVILGGVRYGCTMYRLEVTDSGSVDVELELRPFMGETYDATVVEPRLPPGRRGD